MAIRKYYQLIPEKVLEVLPELEKHIKPKIKGYNVDYLKEVISVIACRIRKDKVLPQIQMTYFKKLIPQGNKYLSELIRLNVVERSGNAKKGESSYRYQISDKFNSRYISKPLNNAKLIRRIEAVHKETSKRPKSIRGRSEQVKYLKQLTMANGYKQAIDEVLKGETDRYNYALSSATRIVNGEIRYSVDDTSHRFHSPVTNLPKLLTPYLRVKGEPLAEIDIKNSQPMLSAVLLSNPSKFAEYTNYKPFSLLLQSLKVPSKEDIKLYIKLSISGQIYEYLMVEFALRGMVMSRAEIKLQMLRILFARNKAPKDIDNALSRLIFKELFPTVHKVFSKVRGNEIGDKFKNYKRFAILLQTVESDLVVSRTLKRLKRESPNTIAISKHDSIFTGVLTNNVDEVSRVIRSEIRLFTSFNPVLSIQGRI